MAQINKQPVVLGGGQRAGYISVNGGAVSGEGGPLHPRLVVPLKFEMGPQPKGAMIAVISFTASLVANPNTSPTQVLCQPVSRQLVSRFPAASQTYAFDYTEEVRFFLSEAEVENIEALRHAANTDVFTLHLDLDVVVAAIKSHNGTGTEQAPWNPQFGTFAEVLPFWTTQVEPLQINIEQSTWVNNVLPGLGYDRLRLVELNFPPPLPDHDNAANDCIGECRGLIDMWEKQLEATSSNPVADVVAKSRGWPENDDRRDLIYTIWQGIRKIMSAPHHRATEPNRLTDRRDARLILLLTVALSEFIA
jgi:hypothetical protein